ncbi:F-box associated domain containing protein [Tanacetum coccineum]
MFRKLITGLRKLLTGFRKLRTGFRKLLYLRMTVTESSNSDMKAELIYEIEDDNTLFVYNPSTRRTTEFPGSKQGGVSLCVSYGFGYDETARDYKVVKIGRCDQTSRYRGTMTMIYSLKAGTWKEVGRFPRANILTDGVFLNGALHWLTRYDWSGIVSLDLVKEIYGEVLLPEYDKGFKRLTLGVLGEWLCVVCNCYKSRVGDVWVMKVYGAKESWTKLACIPHPTNPRGIFLDPLCISKDGKVLLRYGPQLLVCDSKDNSSSEIENFDKTYEACILVESLVSPLHPLGLAVNSDDEY